MPQEASPLAGDSSSPVRSQSNGADRSRTSRLLIQLGLLIIACFAAYRYGTTRAQPPPSSISELHLLANRSGSSPTASIELARRFLLEQRFSEAGKAADAATKLSPNSAEAHYTKALVLRFQNRNDEALTELEKSIEVDKNYMPALMTLGRTHIDRGEFNRAVDLLKRYSDAEPMDGAGYYWYAVALFSSGFEETAFASMEQALKLSPDLPQYHMAMGGFCLNSKDSANRLDRAEQEVREAGRLSPDDWMMRYRLGQVLVRRDKLVEAANELEEAVKMSPRAIEPYFLLPQIYRQLGNKEKSALYQATADRLAATHIARDAAGAGSSNSGKP